MSICVLLQKTTDSAPKSRVHGHDLRLRRFRRRHSHFRCQGSAEDLELGPDLMSAGAWVLVREPERAQVLAWELGLEQEQELEWALESGLARELERRQGPGRHGHYDEWR